MLACLFVNAFCARAFVGTLDCSRVLMFAGVRVDGWKNMKGVRPFFFFLKRPGNFYNDS